MKKKRIFEEPVSEYELLTANQKEEDQDEGEYEQPVRQQPKRRPQSQEQQMDDIVSQYEDDEEVAYNLEDDQQDIVNEAMVRLEQAELYKMLIKHDLFEGVDGNPIAKQNVQNELKDYIVERLQILLGIRQEKSRNTSMRVELPFNRMEIEALKDLANKLTKGASSESQERETVEAVEEEDDEPAPKPMRQPQKLQGLKPLNRNASGKTLPTKQVVQPTKQADRSSQRQPTQDQRNNPKQSNVVVNKNKRKVVVPEYKGRPMIDPTTGDQITEEEIQIAREQLSEDLARSQGKNPYDMDADELIARNATIKTQAISKKVARLPMPTAEMTALHYQTQQQNRSMDNEQDDLLPNILSRVLATK